MSTELRPMQKTGSRNIRLYVTRYSGGSKGVCYQLTGKMEEGGTGYVQLSEKDIFNLHRRVKSQRVARRKLKSR